MKDMILELLINQGDLGPLFQNESQGSAVLFLFLGDYSLDYNKWWKPPNQ